MCLRRAMATLEGTISHNVYRSGTEHIGGLLSRARAVVGSSNVLKLSSPSFCSFRDSWKERRWLMNQAESFCKVYPGSVFWSSRNSASFCSLVGKWHPPSKVPGICNVETGHTSKTKMECRDLWKAHVLAWHDLEEIVSFSWEQRA